jgi:hypothetical protein
MESEPKSEIDKEPDGPIECRAAVAITPTATNEILFLPAGLHSITPVSGGIGKPIKVLIDISAAGEVERQRGEITSRTGKRVYFDFNHEDGPASFWPQRFSWTGDGVVAKGEWTASGKRAVDGKDFRAFSPVFHVDDKRKDPARVVCCEGARPNMGGLVNDPAFSNLPLWAKNAGVETGTAGASSDEPQKEKPTMEEPKPNDEIATLRAKNAELAKEMERLTALAAKDDEDDSTKTKLEGVDAQFRANKAELEAAELRADNERLREDITKRNRVVAKEAVREAVMAGVIPPKDFRTQEYWETQATADPSFVTRVIKPTIGKNRMGNQLTGRNFPGNGNGHQVGIVAEDPLNIFSKLSSVVRQSASTGNHDIKLQCATDFSAIYAAEFADTEANKAQRQRLLNTKLGVVNEAIMAADVTDAQLGTIAGTLVTQRTLELLKAIFPPLSRFTTDFSDQPATYNQTIITRTVTLPTVITYSTATGWADAAAATTDVSVTINNHKGIPITFNENLLASTMRMLFNEFAEASAYQLGKTLVDALYANLTDANFTNNSVFASTGFNRSAVIDIGVALTTRGVPLGLNNRTLLLWPAAFGNLEKDTAVINFATNVPRTELMTVGINQQSGFAISIESFDIYAAPNMPSNNANLIGFAGSKSALIIATRTPNDYTQVLPGASFGNVQMVTDPDIGITVMQVQYVNHTLGTATSRLALMYGTAAGQTAAGQLVKANSGSGSSR